MNHIEIYVKDLEKTRNFYSWLLEIFAQDISQRINKMLKVNKEGIYG